MIYAGLDVGSRTIKLIVFDTDIRDFLVLDTGANPLRRCQQLLANINYDRLVVTGYGRHMVARALGANTVSEIMAHAIGASHLYSDCRTVIDVGGQDSKVILLSDKGGVRKFEMNDRCAAGTGKFLEVMADTLEVNIDNLGDFALNASRVARINSLCTVFAESEVVSLIARGEEGTAIALGIHEAIATRIATMVRRIGPKRRIVFAGGAALNRCLRQLIGDKLALELSIPQQPQIVGALGAALLAKQRAK